MTTITFKELKLPNPGILQGQLPDYIFEQLKTNVNLAIEMDLPVNGGLAGQIEKELAITLNADMKEYLELMWGQYAQYFDYYDHTKVELGRPWVNIQKKHEYNPIHRHSGLASWVVWTKVPYDIQDEFKQPNAIMSGKEINSTFQFIYDTIDGNPMTHNIPVDKSYEGTIIMFPSTLRHCVYPFYTSDEYRISVSGNVIKTY